MEEVSNSKITIDQELHHGRGAMMSSTASSRIRIRQAPTSRPSLQNTESFQPKQINAFVSQLTSPCPPLSHPTRKSTTGNTEHTVARPATGAANQRGSVNRVARKIYAKPARSEGRNVSGARTEDPTKGEMSFVTSPRTRHAQASITT
ncbi:hypothetical protein CALCODRAFT_178497 [Calocera cornea HHB12733]|uniref:Uncharacterized protein n=1 Tax=Calocera cornea HHB12733 TaxID=1353952 RepID=A0A165CDU2_9BASI|nr:hypothetical protein CALCODRAFT_178497 [Calocera cornea HHB12733]